MNARVIEVTSGMILDLGGCRLLVESTVDHSPRMNAGARLVAHPREITPREWQAAEAEVSAKSHLPFEPPGAPRMDRLSLAPRVGGKYHALTGTQVEIARVVGRDGSLWIVIDVNDRPVALRRFELSWRALPRDRTAPLRGDVIMQEGVETVVTAVIGEAQVGGWAVKDAQGTLLHVIRGEASHWISLGAVQLESA